MGMFREKDEKCPFQQVGICLRQLTGELVQRDFHKQVPMMQRKSVRKPAAPDHSFTNLLAMDRIQLEPTTVYRFEVD